MIDETLENFAEVWGDPYLLDDIGTSLSCTEAEALAALLRELGKDGSAVSLIDAHAEGDDEGDEHFRGYDDTARSQR